MAFRVAAPAFFLCLSFWTAQTKIYDRCELARELRDVHEFPEHQLATWLCIANYESHFNTSAHNPGSGDHGIFQISELFWCSPPGDGFACGLPCSALKDDDIEDDAVCARRIYRQHQRMSGDGFTAWVVYNLHCKNPAHVASFLQGCFDDENIVKYYEYQPIYEAMNLPTVIVPMPSVPPSPPTLRVPMPSVPPSPPTVIIPKPTVPPSLPTLKVPKPSARPPSSSLPPSPKLPPSPTTKPPPRKTSTAYTKVQFKSTTKVSPNPVTTPKPSISTYKPFLNLSTRLASSKPPLGVSTFKPVSSTFKPFLMASVKASVPSLINKVSTNRPQFSTFRTSPKPVKVNQASTHKPVSSTFGVTPVISVKPSRGFTHKPITSTLRTIPVTITKITTPKPELSTYKPFLNRISSMSIRPSPRPNLISSTFLPSPSVTTSRPSFSTYKPFLNHFSMGYNSRIYSLSTPKQTFSSGFTSSPFTSSKLFINNEGSNKATVVKPRETQDVFPLTLKSSVNPFEFKRNETIYAFVSNPGYSFAISSSGFKFVRTAN